ncbi:MAG: hypothetical protein HY540_06195 [Deltaproteobacteria bacterium]|nr:hypothetical protein [Deltaproteobacteria bacterium]
MKKRIHLIVLVIISFFLLSPGWLLAEDLSNDTCLSCHAGMKPGVNRKEFDASVHGVLQCVDCHPDVTSIPHATTPLRAKCDTCHEDIVKLHASGLHRVPKDEAATFGTACYECHTKHNIRSKNDPASPTNRANIPHTCKTCHLGVYKNFIRSSHGQLWLKGDDRGPVCITCHKAHGIEAVTSGKFRLHLPTECGNCHDDKILSYKDTFHGQATSIGFLVAAKCSDCHTAHLNLPSTDVSSTIHPQNLQETCGKCHERIDQNFTEFDPHPDPHNKEDSALLYYISTFMFWLLAAVFSFFGLHTILWFQRIVVAMLRKELKRHGDGKTYVLRFHNEQIFTHLLIVVSFLGLAATGIPLKYHTEPWAGFVSSLTGGVEVSRYFHRFFALVTGVYVFYHIGWVVREFFVQQRYRNLFSEESMLPRWKDAVDLFQNLKWFFYLGERPKIGRWAYWEKFDYFAIFWGIPVIGISGLMLWFPEFFTKWLPGSVLNLAMVVHSEEALLAAGFIFTFHFFHNHMRPENFPLDPVIFTGRIPLERFKEERTEEYEKLVREGKLEAVLTGPPTPARMAFARGFGFAALSIGLILIIFIFIAFFS